jgi:hypothetical protein
MKESPKELTELLLAWEDDGDVRVRECEYDRPVD